jgi:hypothetical protein
MISTMPLKMYALGVGLRVVAYLRRFAFEQALPMSQT